MHDWRKTTVLRAVNAVVIAHVLIGRAFAAAVGRMEIEAALFGDAGGMIGKRVVDRF